ncbi:MAG: hypothetical protein BWY68_00797 [bacterium ADurb.Bin400]|nr:MAG: hypothetical protein BWY68_00797 [bacterium ADurb.Bin400]
MIFTNIDSLLVHYLLYKYGVKIVAAKDKNTR